MKQSSNIVEGIKWKNMFVHSQFDFLLFLESGKGSSGGQTDRHQQIHRITQGAFWRVRQRKRKVGARGHPWHEWLCFSLQGQWHLRRKSERSIIIPLTGYENFVSPVIWIKVVEKTNINSLATIFEDKTNILHLWCGPSMHHTFNSWTHEKKKNILNLSFKVFIKWQLKVIQQIMNITEFSCSEYRNGSNGS